MDMQQIFCPNPTCNASGRKGGGNISIHSRRNNRYRCKACGKTFSVRRGTPFYWAHTKTDTMTMVVDLVAHCSYSFRSCSCSFLEASSQSFAYRTGVGRLTTVLRTPTRGSGSETRKMPPTSLEAFLSLCNSRVGPGGFEPPTKGL